MDNRLFRIFQVLGICCVLVMTDSMSAQTMQQIQSDPAYYSAIGYGSTQQEAQNDAMAKIAKSIENTISTKQSIKSESAKLSDGTIVDYSSQSGIFQSDETSAISFVKLQNITTNYLSVEPDVKAFCYVLKSDVEKEKQKLKQKIADFVEAGKYAESKLQIDDALRNYYWAWVLTAVCGESVYVNIDGRKLGTAEAMPTKINSVMSYINANIEDCTFDNDRYRVKMRFQYNGQDVSTLQLSYFDGQSIFGPLSVRNGIGELDLVSLPVDKKIPIYYRYLFKDESDVSDSTLKAVFDSKFNPVLKVSASVDVPVKVDVKNNFIAIDKKYKKEGVEIAHTDDSAEFEPEQTSQKERKALDTVEDDGVYLNTLRTVEQAIKNSNPQSAYSCFTPNGYDLFKTLFARAGRMTLVGNNQDYEFIRANGQVIGRFCRVKLTYNDKGGKSRSFMESLTFRFDETTKKIQSVAFALTKKAEDDIFNAASSWPDVSRFTILQFMEDYQTAYALWRTDYLDKIFSDDAIIIKGTVLESASRKQLEGSPLNFEISNNKNVAYTQMNKDEFLTNLRKNIFNAEKNKYVHLTFEDNLTRTINAPRFKKGTIFAIQIKQMYNSTKYSDSGYLTLLLDVSQQLPIIHVRLWQPEKDGLVAIEDFMNKFKF